MKYIILFLAFISLASAQSDSGYVNHGPAIRIASGVTAAAETDSVQVTVTGITQTDLVQVSYGEKMAANDVPCSSAIYAENTLTLFGKSGKKIRYLVMR